MNDTKAALVTTVLATLVLVAVLLAINSVRSWHYRQGQIDCLNGKIQYERRVTTDTTYTKR